MVRTDDLYTLPDNLPVPVDDGACNHLPGMELPAVSLPATSGRLISLADLPALTVLYCYPRTGQPDKEVPAGWNDIPGARGCTPQACTFRDDYGVLKNLGAEVFGVSTQTTEYQLEAVERLHLPFELLSDAELKFSNALRLPTFRVEAMTLIKRLTLIVANKTIAKIFYPVFPPDRNAADVVDWLNHNVTATQPVSLQRK